MYSRNSTYLTVETREHARKVLEAPIATQHEVGLTRFAEQFGVASHASAFGGTVTKALAVKQARTEILAQQHHLPLRTLGYAPTFAGTRVYPGVNSDWVLMNITEDPTYYLNQNRLVVPWHVAQILKTTDNADIVFDAVFVAHELPVGVLHPGIPLPLEHILPPPPPKQSARLTALNTSMAKFWQGVGKVVRGIGIGTAVAATVISAAPLATVAVAGLDPVLFGLHIASDQRIGEQYLASWTYITHWYWPE